VAEELDRQRPLVGVDDEQLVKRLAVAVVDRERRDHLRDRQPGAEALGLQAHEPVADAGERRQHHAIGDLEVPQGPWVAEAAHALFRVFASLRGAKSSYAPRNEATQSASSVAPDRRAAPSGVNPSQPTQVGSAPRSSSASADARCPP
jgi:hypothetical protein